MDVVDTPRSVGKIMLGLGLFCVPFIGVFLMYRFLILIPPSTVLPLSGGAGVEGLLIYIVALVGVFLVPQAVPLVLVMEYERRELERKVDAGE